MNEKIGVTPGSASGVATVEASIGEIIRPVYSQVQKRPRRVRRPFVESKSRRLVIFMKRVSWRLTAAWCWMHLIMHLFSGRGRFFYFERFGFAKLEIVLKIIGFSPTDRTYFPLLLKLGWLAMISSFSLIEVIWFVFVYVPGFPLIGLMIVFFGKKIQAELKKNQLKRGLAKPPKRRRITAVTVFLLITWLLLYVESLAKIPQIAGIVLAGAFLLERCQVAFSFAGPIDEIKSDFLKAVASFHEHLEDSTQKDVSPSKVEDATALKLKRWFFNLCYFVVRHGALFTRGSRGRSRAAMLVLFQYVLNLVILGCATVLFWALVIRHNAAGTVTDFNAALMASSARVLPGLAVPSGLHLPSWVEAGSSISSWVLFVLYAGPAASIFPLVQQAYVNAITEAYLIFRRTSVRLIHKRMNVCEKIAVAEGS